MRYQTCLLKAPSGRWYFAGSIPVQLGYVNQDGSPVDAETVERQHRLPSNYRSIKCRTFESAEEALKAAEALNHTVEYVQGDSKHRETFNAIIDKVSK